MNTLPIHTFEGGFGAILELLNNHEIEYQINMNRSGALMAASTVIEVIANASLWVSLAGVIAAFLKVKNSRSIKITTKDNQVIDAKGLDSKQLQEVLEHSKNISAIDTDKE